MFSLGNLNKYISECDGCHSIVMPLLESRIIDYANDKRSLLHDKEYYMFYEFLFFEDDYFRIKKDILENNLTLDVVDIGCQMGFQSEIFKDTNKYIGIDRYDFYFNQGDKNVAYITGLFPKQGVALEDKIVISNMSLGYFNTYLGDEWNKDKGKLTYTDLMLIDKLSRAKILYCTSTPSFIEELKTRYKNNRKIGGNRLANVSDGVYKFWN